MKTEFHNSNFATACRLCAVLVASLLATQVFAQTEEGQADVEELVHDFEIMNHESLLVPGMETMGAEDVQMSENWLKRFARKWPKDLVIAPIPGYSPQLGWTLKLAAGYFKDPTDKNSKSPPSVFGGVVMFSENGSSAYGAGTYLHLLDDDLRIQIGGGYADVRYRYYINGLIPGNPDFSVGIEQKGPLFFTKATYRVWRRLYIGVGYLGGSVETTLRDVAFQIPELPELPDNLAPSVDLGISALVIPLEIDSRDNNQFPRSGWKIDGDAKFYKESGGGDFDADVFKFSVNHYFPMRDTDTLATRFIFKSADDGAPFFLQSGFGGDKDLRGYPSGRYRDNKMYAIQTEYRWHYSDRWIFTGFAGFGEVADEVSDFGSDLLPAAGIGTRFVLSEKHKVSLSADVAVGDDGFEFYFGVGEAF